MGEPVRILDIANRMIEMSGRDISIVFTGLREGEKLHEALRTEGEADQRPVHPLISHAKVVPVLPQELVWSQWAPRWGTGPHDSRSIVPDASRSED